MVCILSLKPWTYNFKMFSRVVYAWWVRDSYYKHSESSTLAARAETWFSICFWSPSTELFLSMAPSNARPNISRFYVTKTHSELHEMVGQKMFRHKIVKWLVRQLIFHKISGCEQYPCQLLAKSQKGLLTQPTLSQFWNFKIRRATFMNLKQFADLLLMGL